jgi:hypothetical protein
MENIKLIFGDSESIAHKKQYEYKMEKKKARKVAVISTEVEQDPIYEYSWICPYCQNHEDNVMYEDIPLDNLIKCFSCGKWLKLEI